MSRRSDAELINLSSWTVAQLAATMTHTSIPTRTHTYTAGAAASPDSFIILMLVVQNSSTEQHQEKKMLKKVYKKGAVGRKKSVFTGINHFIFHDHML